MRVLVVGGTAFIGPHVVEGLVGSGHDVTVLHRGTTGEDRGPASVRHVHADRSEIGSVDIGRPDVLLDMIPRNGDDAQAVVAAVRGRARRIVAVSSMDVYLGFDVFRGRERGPPVPLDEDGPLRRQPFPHRDMAKGEDDALWWYDKIPAEEAFLAQEDLPGTVLRLPAVYGPNDRQHRLWEHLRRMVDGRPAIVLDARAADWRWTRGYVENVADAIIAAVTDDRAAGRAYNVGEEEPATEREWVGAIARAHGWDGDVVVVPSGELPEPLRAPAEANYEQHLIADTARIRSELGYAERIDREEALHRTVEWEVANPPGSAPPVDYSAEDAVLVSR